MKAGGGDERGGSGLLAWPYARPAAAGLVLVSLILVFAPPHFIGDRNLMVLIMAWVPLLCAAAAVAAYHHFQVRTFQGRAVFLAVAVLVSAFVLYQVMSSCSMWCCVRNEDLERMCDMAAKVVARVDAAGIPYWVCWGSLLGAAREHDQPFQSIPWEHDFDICFYKEDQERVLATLRQEDSLEISSSQAVDYAFRSKLTRTYVDMYFYDRNGEYLETTEGSDTVMRTLEKDIVPFKKIRSCDHDWNAPNNVDAALSPMYSSGWRTRMYPGICAYWMDGCS